MTTAELLEHLRAEAMKLPEKERLELALSLQESVDESDDFELHPAWRDELARRIDAIDNGTSKGRPAAEAIAEIRARFGW